MKAEEGLGVKNLSLVKHSLMAKNIFNLSTLIMIVPFGSIFYSLNMDAKFFGRTLPSLNVPCFFGLYITWLVKSNLIVG